MFEVATDAGADDIVPATDEEDQLEGYKVRHAEGVHSCACGAIKCRHTHAVTVCCMHSAVDIVCCTLSDLKGLDKVAAQTLRAMQVQLCISIAASAVAAWHHCCLACIMQ